MFIANVTICMDCSRELVSEYKTNDLKPGNGILDICSHNGMPYTNLTFMNANNQITDKLLYTDDTLEEFLMVIDDKYEELDEEQD